MIPKSGVRFSDQIMRRKEGSGAPKGACHPCPRIADKFTRTCATHLLRGCAPFRARPPFGAHACGTRHRLSPRWLSPRTGFPEDGLRECFARSALLPSVKHAPCGPVFLPADRGPKPPSARGHRPSLPSFRLALPERRPLDERGGGYVTGMGTHVNMSRHRIHFAILDVLVLFSVERLLCGRTNLGCGEYLNVGV